MTEDAIDEGREALPAEAGARVGERPRVLARVRQARILDELRASGVVSVADVAAELAVSDMTIRRDLVELERDGHLVRVHGGAVLPEGSGVAMDSVEPTFAARLRQRFEAKERIAATVARIVAAHRTIALDVGTTTFLVGQQLRETAHAKIFTNSLRIATLPGMAAEVYVPGGRVRGDEMSVGGPAAIAQFEALWFDVAVIGVSGVTSAGLYDYSFEDTELKRVFLRRSGLKLVACDASKFQRMSLVQVAGLAEIDVVVTDAQPPPEVAMALAAAGVEVRIAPDLPA